VDYNTTEARWCVVGNSGNIETSDDDGVSWDTRTADGGYAATFNGVVSNDVDFWLAVGNGTEIQLSTNAENWEAQTPSSASTNINDVAFDGYNSAAGLYVVVGDTTGGSGIQTSPDGRSWTERSVQGYSGTWVGVATDGTGIFLAVGTSGGIGLSTNGGIDWSLETVGSTTYQSVIHDGRGLWIIGSSSGSVYTSVNPSAGVVTLTERPFSTGYQSNVLSIAKDGAGQLVAVGNKGSIHRSMRIPL